jgi:glycosyltransferase involved in cell wall biosynthesis
MKIGINLLSVIPCIGGAWNYIDNLVKGLIKYDNENQYAVFVTKHSLPIVDGLTSLEIININIDSNLRVKRVLYENIILPIHVKRRKINCLLWPNDTVGLINVVPSIVIIHDLLDLVNPSALPIIKRIYKSIVLKNTIRNASFIMAISKTTAEEIQNVGKSICKRDLSNIITVPNIVDYRFTILSENETKIVKEKYKLPDKFWLYVAHFYPHKNHIRLLKAYSVLLKSKLNIFYPLLLRGNNVEQNKEIQDIIKRNNLSQYVKFIPYIDPNELPALYNLATALIFPSLYEGGGIPVMEAMACGCPLVASNIKTTKEFAQDAAILFDPTSVESICNAMENFLKDDSLKNELSVNAEQNVMKLRPEYVVNTIKNKVYSQIIISYIQSK